jgi:hypothetical protein
MILSTRQRRLAVSAGVLLGSAITVVAVRDPADRVIAGMSEARVLETLGPPTLTTTDRSRITFFVGPSTCAARTERVLFYERWIRLDVAVAFEAGGTVVCADKSLMVTHGR